ncbi:MAG TPA: hypothetical protein P5096_01315 [Patescibacteria group bacterium]|nr:hypothetical protein [Patescibacteria group bacterium]
MKNINPYGYDSKVPFWKEVGGKEFALHYNGIKMTAGTEVGALTFHTIYAESKIKITDSSGEKEKIIKEYPIEKMGEAKKDFKKLIKQKSQGKELKSKEPNLQELPKIYNKNNFMLVAQMNESLAIYDLRGKQPKEVMQFPNNQYKKARIELLKLEIDSKQSLH